MSSLVLEERAGAVLRLTLNRPDVLNAFNQEMAHALRTALDAAAADAGIRAVLLTGAGRGFCAGQDLASVNLGDGSALPDLGDFVRLGQAAGCSNKLYDYSGAPPAPSRSLFLPNVSR